MLFKFDKPRFCVLCDTWRIWLMPDGSGSCCWNPTLTIKKWEESTGEKYERPEYLPA